MSVNAAPQSKTLIPVGAPSCYVTMGGEMRWADITKSVDVLTAAADFDIFIVTEPSTDTESRQPGGI